VFGNEKGGSGKSTAAVQVAIGLLRQGHSVATLDLDARQGTLSRYMSNREARGDLPMPRQAALLPSPLNDLAQAGEVRPRGAGDDAGGAAGWSNSSSPTRRGNHTGLSRLAHARADVLGDADQ